MATINPKEVLLFSSHYRPNQFFEDSLHRLLDLGFEAVVHHTGGESVFPKMKLRHPNLRLIEIPPTSYDGSMMEFHRSGLLAPPDKKYIVHMDNDLFLSGADEFLSYLDEFIQKDVDFAGHLVGAAACQRYNYNSGTLAYIDDLVIKLANPGETIDIPDPHWETSYTVLKTSLWKILTIEEVGHMKKFVCAMHRKGAKMAAHQANYRWDYSAWGREWYHLGHIMEKYSKLATDSPITYNPDSEFDKFRVGWLAFHEEIYPESNIFSAVQTKLNQLINHFGGKSSVLGCFYKLTKGTCLENWQRYE